MRQKIVAGNWKMNLTLPEGLDLVQQILAGLQNPRGLVIFGAPFTHLHAVHGSIGKRDGVHLAAQNCHHEPKGAFTGEISVDMLASVGVEYVIIGHSERRQYFNEDHDLLARKTDAALARGLRPIFCCGEPLEIREAGSHVRYVQQQLQNSLFHLSPADFSKVVIAYEPIWAIGTGKTATTEQAQEMHAAIRSMVQLRYDAQTAQACSILYGGSCNAANAPELFRQPDVDGGLIGGASLKAADFLAIIAAMQQQ